MNATFFLFPLAAVLMLMMPLVPVYKGITTGKKAKHAVIFNLCAFFGVAALMIVLPMGGFVTVAETAAEAAAGVAGMTIGTGLAYLSAALVTGISCIGAGIAISAAAPAAIGAFSEDPAAFGKALIFVALGEGIGLYGLLISILIVNKL